MARAEAHRLVCALIEAAAFSHREHDVHAGIAVYERFGNVGKVRFAGNSRALDLVDDQPRDRFKGVPQNFLPVGCGIEGDAKAFFVRALHDIGHAVDFVLQNEHVAGFEVGQHLVDIRFRNLPVRAAI